jgi:hypothetical protein
MSIKVRWVPYVNLDLEVNISYLPPEPAFSFYKKFREDSSVIRCPALAAYLKNTFIIQSPYEIVLDYSKESKKITTDRYGQKFFDDNIMLKSSADSPSTLHLFPRYLFISDHKKPIYIEVLPICFDSNNYKAIPGTFDITKWIRPVEYAIELPDTCKIKLNREDPLFMVKFTTEDNDTVILERGILTKELHEVTLACVTLKTYNPKLSLNKLYGMASEYINLIKKKIFKG